MGKGKMSPPASTGGEMRERHKLGKRSGDRRWQRRSPADGAGRVQAKPGIDAADVEEMPAVREHSQHLTVPVIAETDRADRVSTATGAAGVLCRREGELRVGADDGLIKANNDSIVGRFVLGDEKDTRENNGVTIGIDRGGNGGRERGGG